MDSVECPKVPSVRKVKKKQVKDELDRIKQAEKKKRRLEKALATSAAIRSELEMKKQRKKEEQQRLDEEGAAIAEAVALNVLLGEEDTDDDSCKIMMRNNDGFKHWDHRSSNVDLFMGGGRKGGGFPHHQNLAAAKCSLQEIGYAYYGSECKWNGLGNGDWSVSSSEPYGRNFYAPYYEERGCWGTTEISAGLLAAQAVSSLQIAEDAQVDNIVFNGMLRG